jgi:hypothetical protein
VEREDANVALAHEVESQRLDAVILESNVRR